MGFIRGSVVVLVSSLLFLTLFLGNAFLTLSWSLEYNNLETNANNVAVQAFDTLGIKEEIESNYNLMVIYCDNQEAFDFSSQGINIPIPCYEIAKGPEAVIQYSVSNALHDLYYRTYDCSFFECLKTGDGPYVLVSEVAMNYWKSKFKICLLGSILLFVLMFIFIEKKHSTLTVTGILMILSALPFRKLNWLLAFLPEGNLTEMVLSFFTRSYNVFLIMTIIGVSLFAVGIAFEFLGIGLKITKFFTKEKATKEKEKKGSVPMIATEEKESFTKEEVKEIVREELRKVKEKK